MSHFMIMTQWRAGCGFIVLTSFCLLFISLTFTNQAIKKEDKLPWRRNMNEQLVYKTISSITEQDLNWIKKVDTCYIYGEKKEPFPEEILDARKCLQRIPSAMVVGVKKCGTGALSRSLDLHPAVSMSREVHFPAKSVDNHSVAEWVGMMPLSSPNQLPMTENPQYLFSIRSIFLGLKEYLDPNARFIVIIRDPVQRAISDYLHLVAHSDAPKDSVEPFKVKYKHYVLRETFEKTFVKHNSIRVKQAIFKLGKYIWGMRKVLEVYRRDQFLFVDGEEFAQDPFPSLLEIETFLGLPKFFKRWHFQLNKEKGFFCAQVPERPDFECMIPSKGRPHPKLDKDIEQKLYDMYRPLNKALAKKFGLTFPWLFK